MGQSSVKPLVQQKHFVQRQPISSPSLRQSVPAMREVRALATAEDSPQNNLITAYKDLNEPGRNQAKLQKMHLLIGFFVFTVLGLGMVLGQKITATRGLASADMQKLIPAGAVTTANEHYQYDKSCYLGENGERVCMTRTSQR